MMPTAGGFSLLSASDPGVIERAAALSSPAALARHLTASDPRPEMRWQKANHLAFINRSVTDLLFGDIDRLAIFAPPRHGKSFECCLWLPVLFLELFPTQKVILTGYGGKFASEWGGRVRDTIEYHSDFLTVRLKSDSKAKNLWHTTQGGGMMTAGVGGPIMGFGANLFIVDDPIKNSAEAFSPTYRESLWQWWLGTALRCLEPGGRILFDMQRWHDDDLAGRSFKQDDAARWKIISLPARAEPGDVLGRKPGEALWPERYDEDALKAIELERGHYFWTAQYQQKPPSLEDLAAYYAFNYDRNVKAEETRLREDVPLQLALDFNRQPGMFGILGQHFRGEDLLTSRKVLHRRGMTIERLIGIHPQGTIAPPGSLMEFLEWCDAVDKKTLTWTKLYGERLEIFGDATGARKDDKTAQSNWDYVFRLLAAAGIPFRKRVAKSNPTQPIRVNAVNAAFADTDGRARYLIHPDCLLLINDYKYVRMEDGEIDKDTNKDITHASDADGYRVFYLMPVYASKIIGGRIGGMGQK